MTTSATDAIGTGTGIVAVVLIFCFVMLMAIPFIATGTRSTSRALRRAAAIAFCCAYAGAVVAYTVLPLPTSESLGWRCPSGGGALNAQLIPFHFLAEMGSSTGLALVNPPVAWQVVLNVALFMPLGAIVVLNLRRSIGAAIVVAFVCSLVIETSQLTGLWFIYDCAYRLFDVDDIMANTVGAGLGAAIAVSWRGRAKLSG